MKFLRRLRRVRIAQGLPFLALVSGVLSGCGKSDPVDGKGFENAQSVGQSTLSPEERATLRKAVEEENRCLGLVSAVVEVSNARLKARLKEHGLAAIDRIVAVNMLSRVGALEIYSGLSDDEVVKIVEKSHVTISTEADVETYAPQVKACLARDNAEGKPEGP